MSTEKNSVLTVVVRAFMVLMGYRLHISAIFAFLLVGNNVMAGLPLNISLVLSLSLWHFALYLFDRVYDAELDRESQPLEYVREAQRRPLYLLVAALLGGSLVCHIAGGHDLRWWLLLLPVTFLYTVPIVNGVRVKNLFLVKNLFSAVVIWALPLVLQHWMLTDTAMEDESWKRVVSLGIFVLIGEVFWDIRDTDTDRKYRIRTVPNTFGQTWAKAFILLLMAVDTWFWGWSLSGGGVIYLVLLPFTHKDSHRFIFHLPPLIALFRFLC